MLVRVPALGGVVAGGVSRAKLGSSPRRRLVNLQVERAFAAMARSDVEVLLLLDEPDGEVWMTSMASVGMRDCYRGHDDIRTLFADLDEALVDWRWTPREVVDGGDRVAIRLDFLGYGRASGVEIAVSDGGTAARLSAQGKVVWQEWFVDQGGSSRPSKPSGCRSRSGNPPVLAKAPTGIEPV